MATPLSAPPSAPPPAAATAAPVPVPLTAPTAPPGGAGSAAAPAQRRPVPSTSGAGAHPDRTDVPEVVIDLAQLRPALTRAVRLFAEIVVVPTLILMVLLRLAGVHTGLYAVLGWLALTVSIRWISGRRLPGTLLLAAGMMSVRAGVALAVSSALLYLVQPIIGSVFMAVLFLGSALAGRPVTIRLARDFVALPGHLFHSPAVRRMFTQVALLWGFSRLVDVGMSVGFLRWGIEAGLLSRGVFSSALTVLTVAACTAWGWRSLRRIPGISLRLRRPPGAVAAPTG